MEAARRRLAAGRAREGWRRHAGRVVVLAALLGAARPLLWPLGDADPLWLGLPRALGLAFGALTLGALCVFLLARRRPAPLAAARAIDGALERPEVVASGWALEGEGGFVALARRRAEDAVAGFDARAAFPLPAVRPRARRLLGAVGLFTLAGLVGAWDPALGRVLVAPPTEAELAGAAALERAAEALEAAGAEDARREVAAGEENRQPAAAGEGERERAGEARERDAREAPDAGRSPLAEQAHRIARELARGRREAALARLGELRRGAERRDARRAAERQAMRRLARRLGAGRSDEGAGRGAARSDSAEQRMRLLARRLREPSEAPLSARERERTLERLSRAAAAARRSGRELEAPAQRRLAEALERAAAALTAGDDARAAEALERAAARAARLGEARAREARAAEALARLLERAGALERAVQLAMMGRDGEGEGEGPGLALGDGAGGEGAGEGGQDARRGLAAGLAARLAALGLAEGPAAAGGPGRRGPGSGSARASGLEARGDLHARSVIREGERAVQALRGLGAGGEAETGYADVYPGYGAIAEEALAREDVPAARRAAVRAYFEAIRPGATSGDEDESTRPAGEEDER